MELGVEPIEVRLLVHEHLLAEMPRAVVPLVPSCADRALEMVDGPATSP
jgi:hypothetical protein